MFTLWSNDSAGVIPCSAFILCTNGIKISTFMLATFSAKPCILATISERAPITISDFAISDSANSTNLCFFILFTPSRFNSLHWFNGLFVSVDVSDWKFPD